MNLDNVMLIAISIAHVLSFAAFVYCLLKAIHYKKKDDYPEALWYLGFCIMFSMPIA